MTAITATRVNNVLTLIGLTWFTPVIRMIAGENPRHEMVQLWRLLGVPMLAFAVFLGLWSQMASQVETSLGKIPGPVAVYEEAVSLWQDHKIQREKQAAFYERQEKRHAAKLAEDPNAELKWRTYTGKPSYVDQIVTSLKTVFMGFLIATLFAVPIGILCGLSPLFNSAMNPLIQIFKPVSPLAWLPIVTMVVSAVYVTNDPMFDKSFLTSAITVTLCSLWPTLINTSVGVASIDRDLVNVGRVLQLNWSTKVLKMVLPSALPLIFTGLRLSLGVGWMVLIAAEMLAQNPGLGKFVWDEFQNGSSHSLGKIMVAVFTIGIIGFLLDRVMQTLQGLLTFSDKR
ncbi:ABC transporter permease [Thalassospiraceae bacterium LMO-SO8]|jgi:nitrate/nitrite transport system permease protein|nr:ABC transporter permease [Alphaproteobacteria bacterium LMO-S08]WND77146.1 ABC transporter permease [Thalassospiraceae bacterium LMO-SO8]